MHTNGPLRRWPVFSPDGRELLYIPGPSRYAAVVITTEPTFTVSPPVAVPRGGFTELSPGTRRNHDLLPDGRTAGVVFAVENGWDRAANRQIRLVLNWFDELRGRVPPLD